MKYKDIYMVVVKPSTTWEQEEENDNVVIVPLGDTEHTALILGKQGDHQVFDMEKFVEFPIPNELNKFTFKNASETIKSYLVLIKE